MSRGRVLVVDDDEDLREVMTHLLCQRGFDVETAENGQKALDVLDRAHVDLILLDMKMPVMDGWEFATELRSKYGRTVPIIMVTAAWNSEQRAQEIGADDYLDKPFDIDDLVRVVERHYVANG